MSRIPRIPSVSSGASSAYPDTFDDTPMSVQPMSSSGLTMTCGWSRIDGIGDERTGPFSHGVSLSADDSRNMMLAFQTQSGFRCRAEVRFMMLGVPIITAWAEVYDDLPSHGAEATYRIKENDLLSFEVVGPVAAVELLRKSANIVLTDLAKGTLDSVVKTLSDQQKQGVNEYP